MAVQGWERVINTLSVQRPQPNIFFLRVNFINDNKILKAHR